MKKQTTTPAKLQLVRSTIARLNGITNSGSGRNLTDSDTTASTILCKGIMI